MRFVLAAALLSASIASAAPSAVVVSGDSIGRGRTQCPSAWWSKVLADTKHVTVVNVAKDATTITASYGRWTELASTQPYRAVVVEGGTNDLNLGKDAPTIWGDMKAWADSAHALGYVVVVLGIPPRGTSAGMNTTIEGVRTSVNSSASSYAAGNAWFRYVDMDALLGGTPSGGLVPINPAYDYNDGLHPNCEGQAAMAAEIGTRL